MALIVQKYGGTSMGSIERIEHVAEKCIAAQQAGNDLVVAVSAMSGETNRLIALAHDITPRPSPREMDVIMSTGEQVSIALLAIAIEKRGVPAVSYTGAQVKILTDSAHTKARIKGIDSDNIKRDLQAGKIVIVAGFQGVDERGNITYPLAGQVQAKGKTIEELQNILAGRLKRYLKNPQVAINVTEFRSQRISVAGAVTQAGQQPITNVPLTILDAVNQAGGATAEADTQNIKWTHNGVDRTISLQKLIQYGDLTQNHMLSHGDIVYVPSNSNSKIFVMGEVGRQAALPLGSHGLTLTRALGEVGGMNQSIADATGVFVIRKAFDDVQKPIHVYQLNLRDATAYAMGNEFNLRANDVVYVTAAPVARWNRVVSQLTNSITNVNSLDNTFH